MRRTRKYVGMKTRTDVVPIINVSLVVVLTLMVISPFLNKSELEVELPEATTTETEDQDKLEVVLTRDGEMAVDEHPIAPSELPPLLEAHFAAHPGHTAVLKADEGIPYGDVEKVIATMQGAGAPRIALATEQKTAGRTP